MTLGIRSGYEIHEFSDLTTPSVTDSTKTAGVNLAFQITVASIGTSVTIRLEGSLDNTNFFNLDESESDTDLTANGTFGYALAGCPVKYVRVRLVSIDGGSPTVSAKAGSM